MICESVEYSGGVLGEVYVAVPGEVKWRFPRSAA